LCNDNDNGKPIGNDNINWNCVMKMAMVNPLEMTMLMEMELQLTMAMGMVNPVAMTMFGNCLMTNDNGKPIGNDNLNGNCVMPMTMRIALEMTMLI